MAEQKNGERITDEEINEAVATLAAVARRFVPDGWSIHLQCYGHGDVYASLHDVDDDGQVRFVSLHETFEKAINAAMYAAICGNSPTNLEGSDG